MATCPICGLEAVSPRPTGDFSLFECRRCGAYKITGSALAMLPGRLARGDGRSAARLSHAVRAASASPEPLVITSMNLDSLIAQPLPSIERQIANLVGWIARMLGDDALGVVADPDFETLAGVIGALDGPRAYELVQMARQGGLVDYHDGSGLRLTQKGWRKVEELDKPVSAKAAPAARDIAAATKASAIPTTLAHCNTCRGQRNAFVQATYALEGGDGETAWSDRYDILRCCGCDTLCVRHERWFSEHDWIDQDGLGRQRLNRGITTQYWPPPAKRQRPAWSDKLEDEMVRTLIDELYRALDAGLVILATTGARTLFDRASALQVGDPPGGFAGKLQAMVAAGHISASDRRILEAMTDAGNASAHRGFAPDPAQLDAIVGILENYLERVFVLTAAAEALRGATPPRPPRG